MLLYFCTFTFLTKRADNTITYEGAQQSFTLLSHPFPLNTTVLEGGQPYQTMVPLDRLYRQKRLSGKHTKIAILGTGYLPNAGIPTHGIIQCHDMTSLSSGCADQHGHDTITTNILIGQSKQAPGVSPAASIGIYKIVDKDGMSSDEYILKALLKALIDEMDIIVLPHTIPIQYKHPIYQDIFAKLHQRQKLFVYPIDNSVVTPGTLPVMGIQHNFNTIMGSPGHYLLAPCRFSGKYYGWKHIESSGAAAVFVAGIAALYLELYGSLDGFIEDAYGTAYHFDLPMFWQGVGGIQIMSLFFNSVSVRGSITFNKTSELTIENLSNSRMILPVKVVSLPHVAFNGSLVPVTYTAKVVEEIEILGRSEEVLLLNIRQYCPTGGYSSGYVQIGNNQVSFDGMCGHRKWPLHVSIEYAHVPVFIVALETPVDALQIRVKGQGVAYYDQYLNAGVHRIAWEVALDDGVCRQCRSRDRALKYWTEVAPGSYEVEMIVQQTEHPKEASHYGIWQGHVEVK